MYEITVEQFVSIALSVIGLICLSGYLYWKYHERRKAKKVS